MADMKKGYDDLIIINLYYTTRSKGDYSILRLTYIDIKVGK